MLITIGLVTRLLVLIKKNKFMKKIYYAILALTITSTISISCTKDENTTEVSKPTNQITSFKSTKLSESNGKSDQDIYLIENMISTNTNFNNDLLNNLVAKVNMTNKTVELSQKGSDDVVVFNLVKVNSIYKMEYANMKMRSNMKLPRWTCVALCAGQGFGWAMLDGPSPLMDIAAIAVTYSCAKDC